MPKRSNDFQRLIYLIRMNLAEGARVSESKMMRDRWTKRFREVDVVIEGRVGTHPVIVCVECRDHQRIADVTWVDTMKSKHERLDTNALILASRSGFTPEARAVASSYGIQAFTLEEVETADIARMIGPEGALFVKSVTITAEKVKVRVAAVEDLLVETVVTSPDNLIHLEDGTTVCPIRDLVDKLLKAPHPRDHLLREGKEEHKWFELSWEPPSDHQGRPLYMKKLDPEVLRLIECIHIVGPCKVEMSKFGMRLARIGSVNVAWGKVALGGRDAMAVATVDQSGATRLSIDFSGSV